jgi:hypothetical protein
MCGGLAQADETEGTWKLVMRKLPDGTTLMPPTVQGLATRHNGLFSRVVYWHTPEGKPGFAAGLSSYKMSDTEYTETLLYFVIDDGSGKPPTYNLTGGTQTTPVTHEGRRLAYKLPFDPPSVVYDGDKLTATLEGGFVDYWERVR